MHDLPRKAKLPVNIPAVRSRGCVRERTALLKSAERSARRGAAYRQVINRERAGQRRRKSRKWALIFIRRSARRSAISGGCCARLHIMYQASLLQRVYGYNIVPLRSRERERETRGWFLRSPERTDVTTFWPLPCTHTRIQRWESCRQRGVHVSRGQVEWRRFAEIFTAACGDILICWFNWCVD